MTGFKVIRYTVLGALLIALGYICQDLGQRGAVAYERMLVDRVENGLDVLGITWARVEADGLRLELHGHAPDIAARDLALETARATAPAAAITDFTTATLAPPPRRDPVRVELLRDERGVTLTGQTASHAMRDRMNAALQQDAPQLTIHDLTGIQAAQPGRRFGAEIRVASLAASRLPNAYVVLEPGAVSVIGEVADETERNLLTEELLARSTPDISLVLDLSIPAHVIAPFAFSAIKSADAGIRLERCAARSFEEQALIAQRLSSNGVEHAAQPCPVGLGGPEGDWAGVIDAGLRALASLPAGRFDVEYTYARLTGDAPTGAEAYAAIIASLRAALPEGYSVAEDFRAPADETYANDTWFRMTLASEGLSLDGHVGDERARVAVTAYAAALFGREAVSNELDVSDAPGLPDRQTAMMRLLGALREVPQASADITGRTVSLEAEVPDADAAGALQAALGEALPGYELKTRLRIDLPAKVAAIPLPGPRCAALLSQTVVRDPVEFSTGSSRIAEDSQAVLDALARVFTRCDGGKIEIAGHTDSDGSADYNRRLSQARAEAVALALYQRDVPFGRLVPRGYGEEAPIASNKTAAGRARNRRIEFRAAPDAGSETEAEADATGAGPDKPDKKD